MRYFIVLLVVLSFVASFGVFGYKCADTVGAGRFGIASGVTAGMFYTSWSGFGLEYGLSDYLSIEVAGNYSHKRYDGSYGFQKGNLSFSLRGSYDFGGSPFFVGLSLGGLFYEQTTDDNGYSPEEGYFFIHRHDSGFAGGGSLALQAWFVYVGSDYNTMYAELGYPPPITVGLDIDFNDYIGVLLEFEYGGLTQGGISLGLNLTL
jgi:hypothetical protein